jgi:two-component system, cell cycle sensor histidine kinase and response regulator CckA
MTNPSLPTVRDGGDRYALRMPGESQYSSSHVLRTFVLEAMPEPVVVLGPDGLVLESNRAARNERYRGLIDSLGPFGADDATLAFLDRAWHEGRASLALPRAGREGELGPVLLEAFGVELWIVVVVRDDTERQRRDAELAQLRRVESVGVRAASLIHDFNNLMTPMLAVSSMLAGELRANRSLAAFAADIEVVASRSAALLRELVATGRAAPRPVEPLDLNAVIVELGPLIARIAGSQVKVTVALAEQPARALVERSRLEHALLNLVANARNALPEGGEVRIATKLPSGSGGPADEAGSRHVLLVVSDDGVGMTESVREHACDEFFTTREATGGSGLGLASVKRFVIESGGNLTLESEPDRGTTVTLRLPEPDRG